MTDLRLACSHCVDRRTFLAQSTLAAAALALAACGGGADSPTSPTTITATSIKVADYPALAATGGVALITIGGTPLAVVRTGTAAFVALSRICPHQGGTITTTTTGFYCPNHGATFDRTGAWVSGQRTSSMYSYATSYDAMTDTLTIG